MNIHHDSANNRFVVEIGDSTALLEYSAVDDQTLDYSHTFVPPTLRGQGIASQLTEHALQYALEQQLFVVPSCPFVAAFIQSNPKYRKLIKL